MLTENTPQGNTPQDSVRQHVCVYVCVCVCLCLSLCVCLCVCVCDITGTCYRTTTLVSDAPLALSHK